MKHLFIHLEIQDGKRRHDHDGETAVRVTQVKELTEEEYKILNLYI